MSGAQAHGHVHGEAFMLMRYRSDDGTELETVWNSRDGVTPFIISLPSGKQATHVEWSRDEYTGPNYQPEPGTRMFVDTTPEQARADAEKRVDDYWDHPEYPMSGSGRTKAEWIEVLCKDFRPGQPRLVEVSA